MLSRPQAVAILIPPNLWFTYWITLVATRCLFRVADVTDGLSSIRVEAKATFDNYFGILG